MNNRNKKEGAFKRFIKKLGDSAKEAVVPFVMYAVMGLLMLMSEMIPIPLNYVVGVLCVLLAAAYNAYLSFRTGKEQYDFFLTGELHRENELLGIPSGGDHRSEREFRVWKGFATGFVIALPVVVMGICSGFGLAMVGLVQTFVAGWSTVPVAWFKPGNGFWVILPAVLPLLVSGISYLIGGAYCKKYRQEEKERFQKVRELAKEQAEKKKRK